MPLPLLYFVGAAAVSLAGYVAKDIAIARIKRKLQEMGPSALQEALRKMGIDVDLDKGGLNDETITAAINGSFLEGTGIQLASVFDREKMTKGLEQIAIEQAALKLGLPGVTTQAGLRDAVSKWLADEVTAQLAAEAGAVFDAAEPAQKVVTMIDKAKKVEGWNTPTDMTAKGVKNRAYQAKYRHQHTRQWVDRTPAK